GDRHHGLVEAVLVNVTDDTDHLRPWAPLHRANSLTDRGLRRTPVLACECFTDDHDVLEVADVVPRVCASCEDRHAQCFGTAGRDPLVAPDRCDLAWRDGR